MRTLTLDVGALQVETFTTHAQPRTTRAAFAGTVEADCDTVSGPLECETAAEDCETGDCSGPEMCGEPTEDC